MKVAKQGKGTAFASATWHFSTEKLPEAARGDLFAIDRRYFRRHNDGDKWVLSPLEAGERLGAPIRVEHRRLLLEPVLWVEEHVRVDAAGGVELAGRGQEHGLPMPSCSAFGNAGVASHNQ